MTSHADSMPERLDNLRLAHREEFHTILLFFVLSRIVFFVFSFLCQYYIGVEYQYESLYYQYDGYHYSRIGIHGYQAENLYAFFPLFPLIIRFFDLFGIPVLGPLLLNHVLTLATAFFIYSIVSAEMRQDSKTALSAALLWLFSPLSVSTSILYTEAVFIFLTVGAYGFHIRRHPLTAGVFLGLSILTRSMGAMLFVAFAVVEGVRILRYKDKSRIRSSLVMLAPAGLIGSLYPLYLQMKLGNWHYFVDVQYEHWARVKSNIIDMLYKDITHFGTNPFTVVFTYVSLIFCIWLIVQAIRAKGDGILILYAALTILMVFSTARDAGGLGSYSFYRYLFGCASVYLLMNPGMHPKVLIPIGASMSILATAIFCMGGFLI